MPADLALAVVSLLAGAIAMLIFRVTSNPSRIRTARNAITAHVLAIRIYQDDLVLILRSLGAALVGNLRYLRLVWVPLLVIAVVMAPFLIQLDARFDRAPLRPGETAMVTVTCSPWVDIMTTAIDLDAADGAVVDGPRVSVPARHEVNWRVRAERPGMPALTLRMGKVRYSFALAAQPGTQIVGRFRNHARFGALLRPGLPKLPSDRSVGRVEIRYPPARYSILGWQTHWLVAFVIWSLVGALILKVAFRVEV